MVSTNLSHDESPLIAFAGGGTGGHLYPALAVATALRERIPRVRILFFGTRRPVDGRVLGDVDCDVVSQSLPRLSIAPWRWPGIAVRLNRSSRLCRERLNVDRPALVMGTGGIASVPAMREAVRAGIPTAILNPDAIPGRANRYLAASADCVFVQWEETFAHLPKQASVRRLGCPVRQSFLSATRRDGIERFGLDADRKTLLVTGASQGARTINQALVENLGFLESFDDWQVLHLTGDPDCATVEEAYSASPIRATVLPFTQHMADALAAADLVISRAGASTLAEITAVGRPSILMPYPFHRDMHQLANARCLVSAAGGPAASIVHDRIEPELNVPALREALESLMSDDAQRGAMADAALRMGRRGAASDIADEVLALAGMHDRVTARESLEKTC